MGVRAWTWGYDLYQPDRNIIAHLYIASGSPLRPVFWTTDWGARWPCQYRSLLRVQEQLDLHRTLTPKESLGLVDREEWRKYATGPRRRARDFFRWAMVPVVNEWGEKCRERKHGYELTNRTGRQFCASTDLSHLYQREGGMPFVPWLPGTAALYPPAVETDQYPPPDDQVWTFGAKLDAKRSLAAAAAA